VKRNMGTLDRVIRAIVIAPVLVVLGALVFQPGSPLSLIAFALAGIMLATSAVGFCPLYAPLGISTCPRRAANARGVQVSPQP
jgi:Protein of unknown function (DUF2892)